MAISGAIVLGVVGLALALFAWRYLPYLGDARGALQTARQLAAEIDAMQLSDLDRAHVTQLGAELKDLRGRVDRLDDFLAKDPLVGLARGWAATRQQIADSEALLGAARPALEAGQIGIGLVDRFVTIREGASSAADRSLLAGMVDLMSSSRTEVDRIAALLDTTRQALTAVPPDAIGEIRRAADMMSRPIERYGPLLAQYRSVDDVLPAILGAGGQKRYLVLAEDPAELRPTGGYAGTVGVVAFDGGRLVEHSFMDVYALDLKKDVPFVDPPEGLKSSLLGEQPWRLADANWSPDFPTSAQDALRLYQLESGDQHIDGVIALTTYSLDRILNVIGPVTVPDYNITVHPGEVTLTTLGLTRGVSTPTSTRKEFLNSFANTVLDRLFALPPAQWLPLFDALQGIGRERLMLAWFKDPAAQAFIAGTPWTGEIRHVTGDYLNLVEANVAPTSKYNLVVRRSSTLDVAIAADGSATSTLTVTWQNDAMKDGEPYRSIREYSTSQIGLYGAYLRVLTPLGSQLISASSPDLEISDADSIGQEQGYNAFANGLLISAGRATLTYQWYTPNVVSVVDGKPVYRLTIQKQPGMGPEDVTVNIQLPAGARVASSSAGVTAGDGRATFATTLTTDADITLGYSPP